jgi:hypothetical protein
MDGLQTTLITGPDKNGIKITESRSNTFNNDLNKLLADLDSRLLIDCKGQNTINDIKQYPSSYNFFIVSDYNFPLLSSFCLKQHPNNPNLLELWAVCRHRETAPSKDKKYNNITMASIKVVINLLFERYNNLIIWLEVSINTGRGKRGEAVKLIDYYSDIGFVNEFLKNPTEVSPTGIQIGSYHQTMVLDNNSRNINEGQKKRNKSEFLWDCCCLFQERVSFYISKQLVRVLKTIYIKKHKEYGFGFYINQKEERRENIYKLSLVRESKSKISDIKEQNEYEWGKNCVLPPSQVNVFSYMHTHPTACYDIRTKENKNNKFLEINPPSASDINSMVFFNYRFILVPSVEGLHFLKTTNNFNNHYKTQGKDEKQMILARIKRTYENDLQPKLLSEIGNGVFILPNLDQTKLRRLITLYGNTLIQLFPDIFVYKFIEWADTDIYLYTNEIIT